MANMKLKVVDKNGNVLCEKSGEDEVNLVFLSEYGEGDQILVETDEVNTFYHIRLDDAKGSSLVYVTGNITYPIPFGEKSINSSPKVFAGNRHLLCVRKACGEEISNYRNLAENVWDQHGEVHCYPHASANVETRGESVFAALNAIDGVTASDSHGAWPYESWGINRRDDAKWKLEFGRAVEICELVIYTRADFPHDNWWVEMTVTCSDGSREVLKLNKGGQGQRFPFPKKKIEWLEISNLVKADDPSPFPALTQFMVYGRG